jgi:hypothetical protein
MDWLYVKARISEAVALYYSRSVLFCLAYVPQVHAVSTSDLAAASQWLIADIPLFFPRICFQAVCVLWHVPCIAEP